ncbi:myeloperoxidase [Acrocarpospora phusangensis]|uniref:Myeloperoxidase n=1 Tax=Acrocarpospora phusangensis TaxID=1070424 RepID=A0A919UQV7_9ACTN|nr:heme peroxidase family protein [Acrocarpospora phusangensis]GIH24935.1 myeloperoxidase [Acrocarpospora phusangensis]
MHRHKRDDFYVVGEGVHEGSALRRPSTTEEIRRFRFTRLGPVGTVLDPDLCAKLARAMTAPEAVQQDARFGAGFTYLGQFVDHDLTMDRTATALGDDVTLPELIQGRSPALDLDSLYGRGPRFFEPDGVRLRMGRTAPAPGLDGLDGFDLPRRAASPDEPGNALIPDHRNDENLAVAQLHLAFIRFHNRVAEHLADAGVPGAYLLEKTREMVVKHYQWMLVTDHLPRIVNPDVVDEVFINGRRYFEGQYQGLLPGDSPTMPIEFSVAAYRVGHSMIRSGYEWNSVFNSNGTDPRRITDATLDLLFSFSGTSGFVTAENPLPTNWVADFRRLFDFGEAGRDDLVVPPRDFNLARRIDTLLADPLAALPAGSFGDPNAQVPEIHHNLAFRNLIRANMLKLASGQQMAEFFGFRALTPDQIVDGNGGVVLADLTDDERASLIAATPLWFYILREAEFNNGLLDGVGARIVAEVFHRCIEGSRHSIVRDQSWRPILGPDRHTFRMVDLLLYAFEGDVDLLNPVDAEPVASLRRRRRIG